ncbi:MAG: hypothetical protein HN521_17250 [Candidatus Latescibacteria bacterium]|nr:hypothetical protein [Candidatus Latescibacterota bacterium]
MGRIIKTILFVPISIFLILTSGVYGQEDSLSVNTWQVHNFSPKEYNAPPRNWATVQDHRGVMYFGNSAGVLEFDSTVWRLISLPNNSAAFSMAVAKSGRIYVGGKGEIGYLAPNANGQMVYTSLVQLIPEPFRSFGGSIVQTRVLPDGIAFLSDGYLFMFRNGQIDVIESQDLFFSCAYAAGSLFAIDGALGLSRISGNEMQPIKGGELLRSYVLFANAEDQLYMVDFQAGLIVYDPSQQGATAFSNKMQNMDFLKDNEIVSAIPLQNGGYAFGSIKRGLLVVDDAGKNATVFDQKQGLLNSDINQVFQNDRGNLWLSLNNGVSLVNLSQSQTGVVTAQTIQSDSVEVLPFTAYIRQCEGIFDQALLFAGAYYDSVGGIQQLQPSGWPLLKFPYTYNAFRFTFSSSDFEYANDIEYLCYLEGLELDVENASWSKRTYREFTNLYWGRYTLHVFARTPEGEVSREATFSFVIETPWYESLWFTAAQVGFVFLLLFFSGVLNRVGKGEKLSETLIVLSVLIPFEYALNSMESVIGIYTSDIAFFTVLITVLISMLLHPSENFLHNLMRKIAIKKP